LSQEEIAQRRELARQRHTAKMAGQTVENGLPIGMLLSLNY